MNKIMVRNIAILVSVLVVIIAAVVLATGQDMEQENQSEEAADPEPVIDDQGEPPVFSLVSVHDPSIIKDGNTFYVFGSHIEAAKSTDLMQWTRFTNGYSKTGNTLYDNLSDNLAGSFAWAGENDSDSKGGYAVWAPDVLWNEHYLNEDGTKGAFMIYYSASSTYIRSAIGYAVSKTIEGPYRYVDTVVYSGFTRDEKYDSDSVINKKWTNTNIAKLIDDGKITEINSSWFDYSGAYVNNIYPNTIDANLFFDENGKLWMIYGSWSGGIFLLEMDKTTGQAIYPGKDGTTADGRLIDRYFGTKIAGGYTKSGEGSYMVHDKDTGYYYLYMSYGWLGADGGYNIRQFRSTSPEGPYLDASGQNAVLQEKMSNFLFGNKIIGNFLFEREDGEPEAVLSYGYVSPGHNSVYLDDETNQQFLVFHTRFPNRGETHEVRVHQMFMNKEGWPVVAPYPYAGEKLGEVNTEDVVGDYKYINHGKDYSAEIITSIHVRFNEDNTITGDVTGTWKKTGDYQAEITVDGDTYDGVFVRLWDPGSYRYVMTFTALSKMGISIWGSRMPEISVGEN